MSVICHPYADCDTQGESWESIFKRLLVLDENGNLAIRACCCDTYSEPAPTEYCDECEGSFLAFLDYEAIGDVEISGMASSICSVTWEEENSRFAVCYTALDDNARFYWTDSGLLWSYYYSGAWYYGVTECAGDCEGKTMLIIGYEPAGVISNVAVASGCSVVWDPNESCFVFCLDDTDDSFTFDDGATHMICYYSIDTWVIEEVI